MIEKRREQSYCGYFFLGVKAKGTMPLRLFFHFPAEMGSLYGDFRRLSDSFLS
jgi:hypothetical protein